MTNQLTRRRHIRWNVSSSPNGDPPKQTWFFILVNEPREIDGIRQKTREVLAPTDEEMTQSSGLIRGTNGLHYIAFQLNSYRRTKPENVDLSRIYDGLILRDRKLGSHRTVDGLSNYVDNLFS